MNKKHFNKAVLVADMSLIAKIGLSIACKSEKLAIIQPPKENININRINQKLLIGEL